jgi:hypothetical protein
VGGLWPPSGSLSVFGTLPGKIRLLEVVLSNSENISCVAFLKHKNSRKQGTGTVATDGCDSNKQSLCVVNE